MDTRHSKNLPQDLYLFHIFKQLTVKEVSTTRSVSQEWNAMGEKLFKKTKNQEFFMVGSVIQFGLRESSMTITTWRAQPDAIKSSFPKKGMVKLFKSEKACKTYARSLRTKNFAIAEPAIFKVQFTGKIPQFLMSELILLEQMQISYLIAPRLSRKTIIQYFEANVEQLIPLRGSFDIDIYDLGSSTNYGTHDFQNKHKRLTK